MTPFEFYLVLPSSSSMKFFVDNKTTCFTTQLPKEVNLIGEWHVGITEIYIPCTILHISRKIDERYYGLSLGQNYNTIEYGVENKPDLDSNTTTISHIPCGTYKNIDEFIDALNSSNSKIKEHQLFEKNSQSLGYINIRRNCTLNYCSRNHFVTLHEKIANILGFREALEAQKTDTLILKSTINNPVITADTPASLARAIPDQLFVYSDICEPYTVGDTQASLLRIVDINPTKYEFGSTVVKRFAPVNYIKLMKNSFQTIIIDIRDAFGKPIAFEYGTLTVTLHFKRIL